MLVMWSELEDIFANVSFNLCKITTFFLKGFPKFDDVIIFCNPDQIAKFDIHLKRLMVLLLNQTFPTYAST